MIFKKFHNNGLINKNRSLKLRLRLSLIFLFMLAFSLTALAGEEYTGDYTVTFFQILSFGWEINVILGVMMFIAMFMFFHSFLVTRRRVVMPHDMVRKVKDLVAAGDIEGGVNALEENKCIFSRMIVPGLKLHSHSHERITAAMEAAGRRALGGLRQEVTYIANIGALAPMLGLLGTVLGLTKAFHAMGGDGPDIMRSTLMTGSIGEAMGTTAVGLIVGIPAMAAYYICLSRIGRLGDDLEAAAEEISASMFELPESTGRTTVIVREGESEEAAQTTGTYSEESR